MGVDQVGSPQQSIQVDASPQRSTWILTCQGFLETAFQVSECFQGNLFNPHCVQMLTNFKYTWHV